MNVLVLVILGAVWALFLVPQLLRSRTVAKPADSIGAFQRQLSVLERTSPTASGAPMRATFPVAAPGRARIEAVGPVMRPVGAELTRTEARRRRRDVLTALLGAAVVTLALAVGVGGTSLVAIHLLVDAVLVSYVLLLVRAQGITAERAEKVRYMPAPGRTAEPVLALRRSAT